MQKAEEANKEKRRKVKTTDAAVTKEKPTGGKRGRPTVYLEERVRNTILAALRMGLSRDDACYLAGVTPSGFWRFMERVEAGKEKIPLTEEVKNFFNEVKKARSELKIRLLRKIDEAAERNWQAAAWRLERGFPDEFGRKYNEAKISIDKSKDKVVVEIKIPDELRLD